MCFFLGTIPDSDSFQQKWSLRGNFHSSNLGEVNLFGIGMIPCCHVQTKTNPESSNNSFVRFHLRRCHLFQLCSNFRPYRTDPASVVVSNFGTFPCKYGSPFRPQPSLSDYSDHPPPVLWKLDVQVSLKTPWNPGSFSTFGVGLRIETTWNASLWGKGSLKLRYGCCGIPIVRDAECRWPKTVQCLLWF